MIFVENTDELSGGGLSDDFNVMDRLYAPCLKWATKYVRDAGYFGSQVYRAMDKEMLDFVLRNKDNHITLIINVDIQPSDYDAMVLDDLGCKEQVFKELREMLEDDVLKDPVKMLASIIAVKQMTVYVSLRNRPSGSKSLDHSKTGYFTNGEKTVYFDGSFNETYPGTVRGLDKGNKEHFHIYADWETDPKTWRQHVAPFIKRLDDDCKGSFPKTSAPGTIIVEIEDIPRDKLPTLKDEDWDPENHKERAAQRSANLYKEFEDKIAQKSKSEDDTTEVGSEQVHEIADLVSKEILSPTELVKGRKHQGEALKEWKDAGFKGILKHATGSGKTITALSAIEQHLAENKPVILVVPGIPLLNQWEDEIREKLGLNIDLALFGDGRQKNEDYSLFKAIMNKGLSSPTLILCTKDTLTGQTVSPLLKNTDEENLANILFVFDECHKAGEPKWRSLMNLRFGKCLGLSATPERAIGIADDGSENKENGNDIIASLLGEVVHTFDLKDAIDAEYLTGFRYYLHEAELTIAEQKEYDEERKNIGQWGGPPDQNIAIHKARRIVKKAKNKIPIAAQIISENFNLGDYWLIYCATTPMLNEVRAQIGKLNPNLQKEIYEFHSKNKDYRDKDLESYRRQGGIMLAMKCLDEGVNIPNITHGIVLSSSTIEREFIQRRGRMLRKAEGKELAHIYDVICLPHSSASPSSRESILKHERNRVEEFGSISKNSLGIKLQLLKIK